MSLSRRKFVGMGAAVIAAGCARRTPDSDSPSRMEPETPQHPSRTLGKTGALVGPVSLGGEGILRGRGRAAEAVPVVLEALGGGVRYCDTAPA